MRWAGVGMEGQAVRVPVFQDRIDDADRGNAVRGFEARISQRFGPGAEDAAVEIVRFGDKPAARAAATDDEIERTVAIFPWGRRRRRNGFVS
jgi:hypothetical protein